MESTEDSQPLTEMQRKSYSSTFASKDGSDDDDEVLDIESGTLLQRRPSLRRSSWSVERTGEEVAGGNEYLSRVFQYNDLHLKNFLFFMGFTRFDDVGGLFTWRGLWLLSLRFYYVFVVLFNVQKLVISIYDLTKLILQLTAGVFVKGSLDFHDLSYSLASSFQVMSSFVIITAVSYKIYSKKVVPSEKCFSEAAREMWYFGLINFVLMAFIVGSSFEHVIETTSSTDDCVLYIFCKEVTSITTGRKLISWNWIAANYFAVCAQNLAMFFLLVDFKQVDHEVQAVITVSKKFQSLENGDCKLYERFLNARKTIDSTSQDDSWQIGIIFVLTLFNYVTMIGYIWYTLEIAGGEVKIRYAFIKSFIYLSREMLLLIWATVHIFWINNKVGQFRRDLVDQCTFVDNEDTHRENKGKEDVASVRDTQPIEEDDNSMPLVNLPSPRYQPRIKGVNPVATRIVVQMLVHPIGVSVFGFIISTETLVAIVGAGLFPLLYQVAELLLDISSNYYNDAKSKLE
jgi:hypothetical protein